MSFRYTLRTCFVALFFVLGFSEAAFSQSTALPEALAKQLSTYLTQADFTYEAQGDVSVCGEGKLYIQDSCYVLDLNIMKMYSDGVLRWTVDADAKEVYIERVEGGWQGAIAGYNILSVKETEGKLEALVSSQNGAELTLTMPSMKLSDKVSVDFFRFNTSSLDGGWVITDFTE